MRGMAGGANSTFAPDGGARFTDGSSTAAASIDAAAGVVMRGGPVLTESSTALARHFSLLWNRARGRGTHSVKPST
eukprot:11159680-Lingulodinium_polyedra.AAC.1